MSVPTIDIKCVRENGSDLTGFPFYSTTTEIFVMPAVGGYGTIPVADVTFFPVGGWLWMLNIGWLEITGRASATSLYVRNNGSSGNVPAASNVSIGTPFYLTGAQITEADAASLDLYDVLTQTFTVPTGTAEAYAYIADSSWAKVGMYVFIHGGGYFKITAIASATDRLTVVNSGHANVTGGTTVAVGAAVYPSMHAMIGADAKQFMDADETDVTTSNANDQKVATVAFKNAFDVAPNVIVSIVAAGDLGAPGTIMLYARNITTTGFDLYYSATVAKTIKAAWFAVRG